MMENQIPIERGVLHAEIARYLAAVDAFRAAGCEPDWLPELRAEAPAPEYDADRLIAIERHKRLGPPRFTV